MIQDIAPMKFHNEYQQRECRDTDIVFLFSGNKLLVKKDSKISFFYIKEFTKELTKETEQEADGFGNKRLQYLFSIDDVQYYLLKVWSKEEAEKEVEKQLDEQVNKQSKKQDDNIGNMEWVTIRSLRETVSKKDCFAAATAYHLYVWYRDNRYCGRCGKELQPDTKERMMRCANWEMDYKNYGMSPTMGKLAGLALKKLNKYGNMMSKAMRDYGFNAPCSFYDLMKKPDGILNLGTKMGEGWLLTAEMVELIESGYENIICAQPFGCLPNHICGKGVINILRSKFPNANITPIDYDPSATKVNQENRIKLMLAVAKENLNK